MISTYLAYPGVQAMVNTLKKPSFADSRYPFVLPRLEHSPWRTSTQLLIVNGSQDFNSLLSLRWFGGCFIGIVSVLTALEIDLTMLNVSFRRATSWFSKGFSRHLT